MGIGKQFKKFITDKSINCRQLVPIHSFKGKKIAVDVLGIFYRHWAIAQKNYIYSMKFDILTENINIDLIRDEWFKLIWSTILKFLTYGITPIMVMDGIAPIEKDDTKSNRREKSEKANIKIKSITEDIINILNNNPYQKNEILLKELHTEYGKTKLIRSDDILQLKIFFQGLGIPIIDAPGEAEEFCSELCRKQLVDAVYSVDSDNLAYFCPVWIHTTTTVKKDGEEFLDIIYVDNILKDLNLSKLSFLDMCILCGCDYNTSSITPNQSYKFINIYKTIENLSNVIGQDKLDKTNYIKCRNLFSHKDLTKNMQLDLNIDINCVSTYSKQYLEYCNMGHIYNILCDIYSKTSYNPISIYINMSALYL